MQSASFEFLGVPHLTTMGLIVAAAVVLCVVVRSVGSDRLTRQICWALVLLMAGYEVFGWIARVRVDGMDVFIDAHLPLHLCGVTLWLAVITLLTRNQRAYEFTYFWGLAGASNAVATPDLVEAFPDFFFFRFFVVHGGIMVTAAFATWGLGMRPAPGSIIRAFLSVNVLAAGIGALNFLTGWNYMYLRAPPDAPTPFIFLPWPWYIFVLEVIAVAFLLLLHLPFRLKGKDT